MQNQPTNARVSGMLNGNLIEDKALCIHFRNDLQREGKGNKATWDLHQWATNITSEDILDQNRYCTDLDASLGLNACANDKEDDHWIKQESECGLLEPYPSPSSSSFIFTHSSESSESAPFSFRARANKPLKTFNSSSPRVQCLEISRRSRPQRQQVVMGPTRKALKRKRDDYEGERSSGYSDNEGWTTAYPSSSDDEGSSSRMNVSGAESSSSVPSNKRRRTSAFQPGRNRRSHPGTRLPGVKDILKGYERVPYNEPHDPFIFFWSWLMHDREVVESLSVGL